jgi:protein involved in sex pheromone biosynthesis
MKNIVKSRRGESYIDVSIMVLCAMMLIVLALNTFSFFVVKQDLDFYAKEMIQAAAVSGKTTGPEIDNRRRELTAQTGLNPTVTFTATYFNSTQRTVQFGNTITVTLTYKTEFKGFGIFSIPITLTAKHSGLSQRYWK